MRVAYYFLIRKNGLLKLDLEWGRYRWSGGAFCVLVGCLDSVVPAWLVVGRLVIQVRKAER